MDRILDNVVLLEHFDTYCMEHGISWALHHTEPTNTWYISTSSPSPQERIVTKDYGSIKSCVETVYRLLGEVKD